jgi:heme-degrading monooxygenase HmoA
MTLQDPGPRRLPPDRSARISDMVLEVAEFDIQPGTEAAFEAGYHEVVGVLRQSPGLLSARMTHGIETPTRFVLLAEWDSLQAHQAFRDSDRFAIWRGGIGEFFARPPHVEHFTDLD